MTSIAGTVGLVAVIFLVANSSPVQAGFAHVPYFGRPAPDVLSGSDLALGILTATVVVVWSGWELFKPRRRRVVDTIIETQRRVILAMIGLAALGYFNYTYRLPRPTLMLATAALLVVLPAFMVTIRRRPKAEKRAVIVGDDADAIRRVLAASSMPVLGYIGPSALVSEEFETDGVELARVGGLSRLDDALIEADADTVLLGFGSPDRAEFFGALASCHAHDVGVKLHRAYADSVLTTASPDGPLVDVDLEPWDAQDRLLKRAFDIAFATSALLVLAPVMVAISVAIKLDDGGPVFYGQRRTAEFGDTFYVYKFRTMSPGGEKTTPGDERDRITRVGRTLRRTHLDEIPQLWSILRGQMSVVGPRATWTDEETHLEATAGMWRKRWFVKPGLTGLAQINGATSRDPETKLRYDLQYVREQSFWTDVELVLRQFWAVGVDLVTHLRNATTDGTDSDSSDSMTADSMPTDSTPANSVAADSTSANSVATDSRTAEELEPADSFSPADER